MTRLVHERILRPVAKRANGSVKGGADSAPYEIFHDVLGEAVLDWWTRYESERRVALERAESDRRHRRVLGILGVVIVALAAMTAIAAYAVAQRSEANRQATRATSAAVYANQQRVIAEDQTAIAEAATAKALREAENARIGRGGSEVSKRGQAEIQKAAAVAGQNEAERQKAEAENQKAVADDQRATGRVRGESGGRGHGRRKSSAASGSQRARDRRAPETSRRGSSLSRTGAGSAFGGPAGDAAPRAQGRVAGERYLRPRKSSGTASSSSGCWRSSPGVRAPSLRRRSARTAPGWQQRRRAEKLVSSARARLPFSTGCRTALP